MRASPNWSKQTVLKFPIIPYEEQTKHSAEVQRFRSSVRAADMRGLEVEEQILRILGKYHRIIQLKGKHKDGLLLKYLPNGSIKRYLRSNAPYTTMVQVKIGATSCRGSSLDSHKECPSLRCKHWQSPARFRSIYQALRLPGQITTP